MQFRYLTLYTYLRLKICDRSKGRKGLHGDFRKAPFISKERVGTRGVGRWSSVLKSPVITAAPVIQSFQIRARGADPCCMETGKIDLNTHSFKLPRRFCNPDCSLGARDFKRQTFNCVPSPFPKPLTYDVSF